MLKSTIFNIRPDLGGSKAILYMSLFADPERFFNLKKQLQATKQAFKMTCMLIYIIEPCICPCQAMSSVF